MQPQLAPLERAAQVGLQLQQLDRAVVHGGIELHPPPAALPLGAVERGVGVAHDVLGLHVGRASVGDADAGAAEDLLTVEHERGFEGILQAVGHPAGALRVGDVLE